ncbi:antiviral reverse transcriptase Drt3a [Flagellimonas nanhaiensis]|uniref:Reverse transcriptase domain-containing protein n=1 Tax=Flagellimonas nanhaiensis TaxID=2292706 RepID=A0A371JUQ8_9FLAO|nr:antiviral reverse transcriptase Drt3a [Allomuricauda nanhaiensis]RDY61553.1 hypothetical protein DX873_05180 [Allomuricauda nanhaiensis]
MLNQSFTKETFQEIFDRENRKGKNIEKLFKEEFSDSLEQLKLIQAKTLEIRNSTDSEHKKLLYQERKTLRSDRDALIKKILDESTRDLPVKINNIQMNHGPRLGKPTFILEKNLENYFMSKKVQWNLARTYKVKQANRYAIVSQLINTLEDKFPKYVVRTDIKSFYETIPQKPLLSKINDDHLLSVLSKKFINKVIEEYNRLTGQVGASNPKGVPRGVGISPYLSELYMRIIDNEIRLLDDLVYYSRYVDDIIAVFVPADKAISNLQLGKYKTKLLQVIKNRHLDVNIEKTHSYNLTKGIDMLNLRSFELLDDRIIAKTIKANPKSINYLGCSIGSVKNLYKFSDPTKRERTTIELSVDLSEKKILKYKEKIKSAFDDFKNKRLKNERRAFKLLKTRIQFLCTNTKLRNNKANVLIGIYYSNPFVNNPSSFDILDKYFYWHIYRAGLLLDQKNELKKLNFKEGFDSKRFIRYPLKKEVYKNHNAKRTDETNKTNRGIIRFGLKEINSVWKKH